MAVVVVMVMAVSMAVFMFMFVRVTADFHVAAAETASTFFAHKILGCSGGL